MSSNGCIHCTSTVGMCVLDMLWSSKLDLPVHVHANKEVAHCSCTMLLMQLSVYCCVSVSAQKTGCTIYVYHSHSSPLSLTQSFLRFVSGWAIPRTRLKSKHSCSSNRSCRMLCPLLKPYWIVCSSQLSHIRTGESKNKVSCVSREHSASK